jgi:aminomuconate-semialdehyde/2-hydroxymuconate-6-semialdehyde dehydrogenase
LGAKAGARIVAHEGRRERFRLPAARRPAKRLPAPPRRCSKNYLWSSAAKTRTFIFADCDYEEMLQTTVRSSFSNQGQICLCGSRIFVERPIYERFKADFVERVSQLKIGDPLDEKTNVGAVASKAHLEKVLHTLIWQKRSGKYLLGGTVKFGRCENGYFIEPTIIENLHDCRTIRRNFGAVVRLAVRSRRESFAYANSSNTFVGEPSGRKIFPRAHRSQK